MRKNKRVLAGFCAGLLTAAIIFAMDLPSKALSTFQQINVSMGGISLYIDGRLQVCTNVNGDVVEPILYDGTTYLPVRALTEMLTDKEIDWDGATETVYIGTKPGPGEVVRAEKIKIYDSSSFVAKTGKEAQFKILDEAITPFNLYKMHETIRLNGLYSELKGTFVIPYTKLGASDAGKLSIYAVDRYGVRNLLQSYELYAGDDAVDVDVNIRGCDFLYISLDQVYDSNGYDRSKDGAFYNVTLTKVGTE